MNCCYKCENRKPNCHSGCVKYVAASLAISDDKKIIKEKVDKETNYYNYVKSANDHMKKRKKHRRV